MVFRVFLGRIIEALNNIFKTLVDCYYILNLYENLTPQNINKYYDKIEPKIDYYFKALTLGSLHLTKEQD